MDPLRPRDRAARTAAMDAFKYFQDLPAELRIKIWNMSRQPRVVEVWYDIDADCCRTTARPPALLHVNREARAEALHKGWYRRAFRTRSRPRDHYIYFSPALDVLYLPRHGLMGYDDTARDFAVHVRDTAEHVRALAIDHVRSDSIRPWEPYNKLMLLLSFPHLQEAVLVVGASPLPPSASASPVLSASYDRRVFRRRSQESIESAESVLAASLSSSPAAPLPPASLPSSPSRKDDVQLVDPQGDSAVIMGVIDNVIESFAGVIQATAAANTFTNGYTNGFGFASDATASLRNKDDAFTPSRMYPNIPSLIPKAIAYHRQQLQRQRQRHRQAFIELTESRVQDVE